MTLDEAKARALEQIGDDQTTEGMLSFVAYLEQQGVPRERLARELLALTDAPPDALPADICSAWIREFRNA